MQYKDLVYILVQVSLIVGNNDDNVGARSIVVELRTSMRLVVGSNPAQSELALTVMRN